MAGPQSHIDFTLVEWNIAMAAHKKATALATLSPSIAVLPECADLDKSLPALGAIGATDGLWAGSLVNKGLGVFAFADWSLSLDESYDPGFPWLLPVHLTGPAHIRLLAVWDMHHRGNGQPEASRAGSARASVSHYAPFLTGDANVIIASGDFNNAVRWDRPRGTHKWADLVALYAELGLVSAYHHTRGCAQGEEPEPTHWWQRNPTKTYHIDYTFVSRPDLITGVSLGSHDTWIAHSDHSPMSVHLRLPVSAASPRRGSTTAPPPVVPGGTPSAPR